MLTVTQETISRLHATPSEHPRPVEMFHIWIGLDKPLPGVISAR